MGFGGIFLRTSATTLYATEFICAIIILGIYGYFLAVSAKNDIPIPTWVRAVEGLSGSTALYLLLACFFTRFLGEKTFFAFLAIMFNLMFFAVFLAIAVLTRDGIGLCKGLVNTPLGSQESSIDAPGFSNFGYACNLNKVCFAVSIIGAGLLIFSIIGQVALSKHHKREKRYGPSPDNKFKSGSGSSPWWRRHKASQKEREISRDAEAAAVAAASQPPIGSNTNPYGYDK